MRTPPKLFLSVAAVVLLPASLSAQRTPIVSADSVVRPASAMSSGDYTPSSLVMIENRARTLGDRCDASGTRYFAVKDSDLIGKKPQEIVQLLAPTAIKAGDGVRKMEVLVDLQKPIMIYTNPGQSAYIGTVVAQGSGLRQIEVHSSIFANDLTIVGK